MLDIILYLPRRLLLAHFVLFVNLTTPAACMNEGEMRIERFRRRIFCLGKSNDA